MIFIRTYIWLFDWRIKNMILFYISFSEISQLQSGLGKSGCNMYKDSVKYVDVYRERPIRLTVRVLVPVREHPKVFFSLLSHFLWTYSKVVLALMLMISPKESPNFSPWIRKEMFLMLSWVFSQSYPSSKEWLSQ